MRFWKLASFDLWKLYKVPKLQKNPNSGEWNPEIEILFDTITYVLL